MPYNRFTPFYTTDAYLNTTLTDLKIDDPTNKAKLYTMVFQVIFLTLLVNIILLKFTDYSMRGYVQGRTQDMIY